MHFGGYKTKPNTFTFTFSDSLMYVTLYITVLPREKEVAVVVFTLFILLLL